MAVICLGSTTNIIAKQIEPYGSQAIVPQIAQIDKFCFFPFLLLEQRALCQQLRHSSFHSAVVLMNIVLRL